MDKQPKELRSFIDEVTAGLKDDAELRSDVEQELEAHLEEAREAFIEEGHSEAESQELALKAFGSPVNIAEELTHSNQSRMKLRASMRLLLGGILVPLSLVIALFVFVHHSSRMSGLRSINDMVKVVSPADTLAHPDKNKQKDPGKAFLFHGDTTRKTKPQQQRAIWEKTPDSKVYFGNYIRYLLNDYRAGSTTESFVQLEKEIRLSEQVDPENAFYNYLLAGVFFRAGAKLDKQEGQDDEKKFALEILDPALLKRGLEELRKAAAKPNYKRYALEMNQEQLDTMPPVKRFEDKVARIGHMASIIMPSSTYSLRLFKTLPYYAESLAQDGNTQDTEWLLNAWYDYTRKANGDAWTLIDVLVNASTINLAGEKNADVFESLNRPEEAARLRKLSKQLGEPHRQWREQRESAEQQDFNEMIMTKGSILVAIMMPAIGQKLNPADLGPGRMLEYNLIEQVIFMFIMVGLLVFMISAALLYGLGRSRVKTGATPMLLLPPAKTFLSILGLGILLPILLYLVYSRLGGFGSHEYSVKHAFPQMALEILLLVVTLFAATTLPASRYIYRRCCDLGVPAPRRIPRRFIRIFWSVLGACWLLCIASSLKLNPHGFVWLPICLAVVLAGSFFPICFYQLIRGLASKASHGLYFGTLARSLIPVYACAVIFVGGICLPYLSNEETVLVQQDQLISVGTEGGFTKVETDLVRRLQSELDTEFKNTSP